MFAPHKTQTLIEGQGIGAGIQNHLGEAAPPGLLLGLGHPLLSGALPTAVGAPIRPSSPVFMYVPTGAKPWATCRFGRSR